MKAGGMNPGEQGKINTTADHEPLYPLCTHPVEGVFAVWSVTADRLNYKGGWGELSFTGLVSYKQAGNTTILRKGLVTSLYEEPSPNISSLGFNTLEQFSIPISITHWFQVGQ